MHRVIARLKGGLGNQMFQHAIARAVATLSGGVALVDAADLGAYQSPRRFSLGIFGIEDSPGSSRGTEARVVADDGMFFRDGYTEELARLAAEQALVLDGYFQSEVLFRPCAEELRDQFLSRLPRRRERPYLAVHVRRGDYVGHGYHDVCSEDFYRRGIAHLRERQAPSPVVFVSDDLTWCESTFRDLPGAEFVRGDERDHLALLAHAEGLVLCNSTFGWWGAWLSGRREVVLPNRWFNGGDGTALLDTNPGWVKLEP